MSHNLLVRKELWDELHEKIKKLNKKISLHAENAKAATKRADRLQEQLDEASLACARLVKERDELREKYERE